MPRTKGAKNKKPYAIVTPGKEDKRFVAPARPTGRTEAIAGRVSPEVRAKLETEGVALNWGERIENAIQRLIRLESVSANTNNGDDFCL